MSYAKDSIQSIRETRHSQVMGEILTVVNKWVSPGVPGNSEIVLLDDSSISLTTYHYHYVEGVQHLSHITHAIKIRTNVFTEQTSA